MNQSHLNQIVLSVAETILNAAADATWKVEGRELSQLNQAFANLELVRSKINDGLMAIVYTEAPEEEDYDEPMLPGELTDGDMA